MNIRTIKLLTLTNDKDCVDVDIVQTVRSILDYEFNIRRLTDPIDADNKIARLEEGVRRVLATVGSLDKRNLRRRLHADRYGLWAYERALADSCCSKTQNLTSSSCSIFSCFAVSLASMQS